MASRRLEVVITGDSRSLERSLGRASNAAGGFGSSMAKAGKLAAIGLAAGVGIAAYAATKFAKAALEAEKSQTRLSSAFEKAGASAAEQGKAMTAVNKVMNQSGLDDEDLQNSLSRLLQTTGNVATATKDMGIAADVARGRGIKLEAATMLVTKAQLGNVGALKRIGIEIPKVTAATDALRESHKKATAEQKAAAKAADDVATRQAGIAALQAKFGGDAEKYGQSAAGAMERFQVAAHNVEEGLGAALLPTLAKVGGGIATFLNQFNQAKGLHAKLSVVWEGLSELATNLATAISGAIGKINWGQVAKAVGDAIQRAVQGVDWGGIGERIRNGLDKAGTAANISAWGANLGGKINTALTGLSQSINRANWGAVGAAIVSGLAKALAAATIFLASAVPKVALGLLHLMAAVLHAQVSITLGAGKAIGAAIIQGIGAGAQGVGKVIGRVGSQITQALVSIVGEAAGWAKDIGISIVTGLAGGLAGLAGMLVHSLIDPLKHAASSAWNAIRGHSPSKVFEEIGISIGQGLEVGVSASMLKATQASINAVKNLTAKLAAIATASAAQQRQQALADALIGVAEANKKGEGIAAAERQLAQARQDIVIAGYEAQLTKEQAALDRRTAMIQKQLDKTQAVIEKAQGKAAAAFDRLQSKIMQAFDAQTAAHKGPIQQQLEALQGAHDAATQLQDMADAQKALADAQGGGDPEAIVAAQRRIDDLVYQQQVTSLQTQATQEATAYDQMRTTLGEKLGDRLTLIAEKMSAEGATYDSAMGEILKIMKAYGIDFATVGADLGESFLKSLRETIKNGARSASVVSSATGGAKKKGGGPLVHVGGRAAGGPVFGGIPYMVGERGPEMFVPKTSGSIVPNGGGGMGGPTVIQLVVDRRVLAEIVRDDLIQLQRRNGTTGLN